MSHILIPDHVPQDCADTRLNQIYGNKITASTLKACKVVGPNGPIPFNKLFTLDLKEGDEEVTDQIEVNRDDTIGIHSVGPTLFVKKGGANGDDVQLDQRSFFGCGPPPTVPDHTPIQDQTYLELNTGRAYQFDEAKGWESLDNCCIRVSENSAIVSTVLDEDGCLIFNSVADALTAGRNQIAIRDGIHAEAAPLDGTTIGAIYIEIMQFAQLSARFENFGTVSIEGQGTFVGTTNETLPTVTSSSDVGTQVFLTEIRVNDYFSVDRGHAHIKGVKGTGVFVVSTPPSTSSELFSSITDSNATSFALNAIGLEGNAYGAKVLGNTFSKETGGIALLFGDLDQVTTSIQGNTARNIAVAFEAPFERGIKISNNNLTQGINMTASAGSWYGAQILNNRVQTDIALVTSQRELIDPKGVIKDCQISDNFVGGQILTEAKVISGLKISDNNLAFQAPNANSNISATSWVNANIVITGNKQEAKDETNGSNENTNSIYIQSPLNVDRYTGSNTKCIVSNNVVGGGIGLLGVNSNCTVSGNVTKGMLLGTQDYSLFVSQGSGATGTVNSYTTITGNVSMYGNWTISKHSNLNISNNRLNFTDPVLGSINFIESTAISRVVISSNYLYALGTSVAQQNFSVVVGNIFNSTLAVTGTQVVVANNVEIP